jgi:hypothetical protein
MNEEECIEKLRYNKVIHTDGVTTTFSDHKFEISVHPKSDIWEQAAVQKLRDWCRARRHKMELKG